MIVRTTRWSLLMFLSLALTLQVVVAQRVASAPSKGNNKNKSSKPTTVVEYAQDDDTKSETMMTTMALNGNLDSVELGFSNIRLEIKAKKKNKIRTILDGSLHGRARPGRMLAVMGPSGAGKSVMLHAIAGRIAKNKKTTLSGRRYINGGPISGDSMVPAAFIEQEVNFFPHMTVRETLTFRVELKLGSQISPSSRTKMVDDLLQQLNLEKTADTIVGDSKVRGISGGERRRLSIACELISSPSVIMLDEPTSGLDSTAANILIENLRNLADAGKTIIAVIHQPSQHVFSAFDDLLLLSEGKQMYFGETDKVRAYMEKHARVKAPSGMGTAEHMLDCISSNQLPGESEEDAMARMERIAKAARDDNMMNDIGIEEKKGTSAIQRFVDTSGGPKAGIFKQFRLLMKRSLKENFRGKAKLIIELVKQVSIGLVYGGIYSIGNNQASIQDRFGLLSLIAIGSANMAVASTVRAFPKEKEIVFREVGSKMYGTLPYFIGKAISEIPLTSFFNSLFGAIVTGLTGINGSPTKFRRFLGLNCLHGLASQSFGLLIGAASPSSDVALAMFPAVMVLNIIFDGKNIAEESIPKLLRWLPKIGLIRWGFEGFCLNEFEGLEFTTKEGRIRGPVAKTGYDALSRFGLTDRSLSDVMKAQIMITVGCWFFNYLGLSLTRQKYQYMIESNGDGGQKE